MSETFEDLKKMNEDIEITYLKFHLQNRLELAMMTTFCLIGIFFCLVYLILSYESVFWMFFVLFAGFVLYAIYYSFGFFNDALKAYRNYTKKSS
jgi:hypothetical protein